MLPEECGVLGSFAVSTWTLVSKVPCAFGACLMEGVLPVYVLVVYLPVLVTSCVYHLTWWLSLSCLGKRS